MEFFLTVFALGFGLWALVESPDAAKKVGTKPGIVVVARALQLVVAFTLVEGLASGKTNSWLAIPAALLFGLWIYYTPQGCRRKFKPLSDQEFRERQRIFAELDSQTPASLLPARIYADIPPGVFARITWAIEENAWVKKDDPVARYTRVGVSGEGFFRATCAGQVRYMLVTPGVEVQKGTLIARIFPREELC
jgi:hypothetical protein